VLVGTPGRLDDIIKRCSPLMDLKSLEVCCSSFTQIIVIAMISGWTDRHPQNERDFGGDLIFHLGLGLIFIAGW
jgi:hypothetical protein